MTNHVEIKKRTIEGTAPGPHLLITGGVHGDEFEPIAAIRRLAKTIQAYSLHGRLTLVPIANEPAFLHGSRAAQDGLDLARICPGRADGSSTERIAHELSGLICTADYYIDLHTGGTALCILPFVGFSLHRDPIVLEWQRRMASAFNLPIVWGTPSEANGRTLSIARDAGVPAIYAEYLGGGRFSPHGMEAYVDGCSNVMRELGMIKRTTPASKIVHAIEDSRPNAGHLQISHPAPMTGFFEPTVELGKYVQKGEVLGLITADALGDHVHEILSEHSGIVLCLATYCRVLKGGGVAVVLEIDGHASSDKSITSRRVV